MSDLLDVVAGLALGWLLIVAVVAATALTVWVFERLGHDRVAAAFHETEVPHMWTGDET